MLDTDEVDAYLTTCSIRIVYVLGVCLLADTGKLDGLLEEPGIYYCLVAPYLLLIELKLSAPARLLFGRWTLAPDLVYDIEFLECSFGPLFLFFLEAVPLKDDFKVELGAWDCLPDTY